MNKRVENYILWLNRLRAARRRTTALVLALSLVVSGNVFWLMKGVGTALEDEPSCGLTEHSHTEECYEKVLICEEDHEHTDECYETRLICGMEEHTHTDACYISAVLERENQADWEKTLPQLTGTYSSDLSSEKELNKFLSEGWKIIQISAAGTNLTNYCWVLLQK